MDFESAVRQELSEIPEIGNKVFPLKARDGVDFPYIVYVSCEGLPDKTLSGFRESNKISLDLNILHGSYGRMKDLAKQVIAEVKTWDGAEIGDGSVFIQSVHFDDESFEQYEREVGAYRKMIRLTAYV